MAEDAPMAENGASGELENGAENEELKKVAGDLSELALKIWTSMEETKALDASDNGLDDDMVRRLINGLHTIAKQTGYLTERLRPFPCESISFARNPISRAGCGEVVQLARTHGCNAASVDLSKCRLDDTAATEELSRLVKNSGTWRGASTFLTELRLDGNNIGKAGASKLIQYAHWARVGYTNTAPKEEEKPPVFVLRLADNAIGSPGALVDEMVGKKIKVSAAAEPEPDTTVLLPDFDDQRDPLPEPPPRMRGGGSTYRRPPDRGGDRGGGGGGGGGTFGAGECWDFKQGRCFRASCKFSHSSSGGGGGGGRRERERDEDRRRDRDYDRRGDRDRESDRRDRDYDRRDRDRDRRRESPPRRGRSESEGKGRSRYRDDRSDRSEED